MLLTTYSEENLAELRKTSKTRTEVKLAKLILENKSCHKCYYYNYNSEQEECLLSLNRELKNKICINWTAEI